jgi:hypothetical protein
VILPAAFLAAVRPAAAPRIDLHVDLDLRVNAVYHVACLSGSLACTKDMFVQYWKDRTWTADDDTAVDAWRQVMAAVTAAAPSRHDTPLLPNTPRFHPSQAARTAVVVAAIECKTARDLRINANNLVSDAQAQRLLDGVDHFQRRLQPWFKTIAGPVLQRRVTGIASYARASRFAETAEQMSAFLEADLPAPDLYLHAIAAPVPASAEFSATQLGSHLLVEVVDTTQPDAMVSGAVHELTHYIYERAPVQKHLALIREFVESGHPSAAGLYTYLNEAVAVGAQSLHAWKNADTRIKTTPTVKTENDDEYHHPYIAPLGAAASPLVKDAVWAKRTLFQGFAARYISAGTAALKEKVREPQFVLAQVGLVIPENGDNLRAAYLQAMFPHASATLKRESEAEGLTDVALVRFARYGALGDLEGRIPELATLRVQRGFAYALPRAQSARLYVLAGRDDQAIIDVIGKFADMKELSSTGLLFFPQQRRSLDGGAPLHDASPPVSRLSLCPAISSRWARPDARATHAAVNMRESDRSRRPYPDQATLRTALRPALRDS